MSCEWRSNFKSNGKYISWMVCDQFFLIMKLIGTLKNQKIKKISLDKLAFYSVRKSRKIALKIFSATKAGVGPWVRCTTVDTARAPPDPSSCSTSPCPGPYPLLPVPIPQRRKCQPTPLFLHGKFHAQRSPGGRQSKGLQGVGLSTQYLSAEGLIPLLGPDQCAYNKPEVLGNRHSWEQPSVHDC